MGGYWRPVFNILEVQMAVLLVNARHVKAVPGRKTDIKYCEWLADLLRHGLLKPAIIRSSRKRTLFLAVAREERPGTRNLVQSSMAVY